MENEFELKPFDKVLVRDNNNDVWAADIFEKYKDSISGFYYECITSVWKQCIPYKGNEHLLGTTDTPKRYNLDNDTLFEMKLKPFDKVLVRYGNSYTWQPELFYKFDEGKYYTLGNVEWPQCIPYKGNEHLLGTSKSLEIIDLDNNILFGIELKVGYVLEFEDSHIAGVIIPTNEGLAISYLVGGWAYLKDVTVDNIEAMRGPIENGSFIEGKVLWHK